MDHKTVEIPKWQYEVLTKIAFHALKLADDLGWEESWDGKEEEVWREFRADSFQIMQWAQDVALDAESITEGWRAHIIAEVAARYGWS